MANYTSLSKVQALLGKDGFVDETTDPTKTQAETWITDVEARLDLALITGGQTAPATDATQVAAFDLVCAQEVAWLVLVSRRAAGDDPNEHPYHKAFLSILTLLEDGSLVTASSTANAPWSYTMEADEDDTTDPLGPTIRKDQTF